LTEPTAATAADVFTAVSVRPDVAAAVVEALSPRLRKRLDAAVAKLRDRPATRDGDTWRIAVDDEAALTLDAPGGVVTRDEQVVCACLLAPACSHRAAVVSGLGVALEEPAEAGEAAEADAPAESADTDDRPPADHRPESVQAAATDPKEAAARVSAAQALRDAAAAVLDAGTAGSGAVVQAGLLRAAHTAKLAGLHRAAAAAVAVTAGLRAARADDPAFRLAELTDQLVELLDVAHRVSAGETGGEITGTARQAYAHAGSLRLHGLFTETIRTDTGHAGVVTYTVGADGVLRTVADVMPGGPERIAGAAARAIRMGDAAVDHHALTRAGLLVSGATESPTGRLGAGAAVKAVRSSGVSWHTEPLASLWDTPPADQAVRAAAAAELPRNIRRAGAELMFLDAEILGAAPGDGGADRVLARCGSLFVSLLVADDHPKLAYRDNLRLLASRRGLRIRLVGRLEPGPAPAVRVLAVAPDPDQPTGLTLADALHGRVNLGLDRLRHADVGGSSGAAREHASPADGSGVRPVTPPFATLTAAGTADEASPAYVIRRHVERAVTGGRQALALAAAPRTGPGLAPGPSAFARDTSRLRRCGMAGGAAVLDRLAAAAGDRGRDVFGRLLPADTGRLADAWLAAALYERAVGSVLTASAWGAPEGAKAAAE
jgi:hypothetical protein